MNAMLPVEFADLEPFAATWCLPTETQRWDRRIASPMPELIELYDAAFPRLEAAIAYCDGYALEELPREVEHLLQLVYSIVQAAMAVEIFGQPKTVDAADAVLDRVKEPRP
jgi:hypothetical protein